MIIHAPRMRNAILINTTSVPPKYLPSNSCVREIGLESNKSMLPLSSIIGIKLAEENIARSKHRFDSGAVIANCICVITCSRTTLSPDGFMPDKMESVLTRLKTTASPIKKITEIAAKNIKTFRANASRKVYHDIIKIFFMIYFSYQLH